MSEKPSSFHAPLAAAVQHALRHVAPSSDLPVAATADLKTLRSRLTIPLNNSGIDATTVIEDLAKAVEGGIIDTAGPRFFGWVIGGSRRGWWVALARGRRPRQGPGACC